MTAAVAPRRQPQKHVEAPTPRPPRLRVVEPSPERRRRRLRRLYFSFFGFILAVFFLVAFAHASLVETQRELDQIHSEIDRLEDEAAKLERQIDVESAPAAIVGQAEELGYVHPTSVIHLQSVGT